MTRWSITVVVVLAVGGLIGHWAVESVLRGQTPSVAAQAAPKATLRSQPAAGIAQAAPKEADISTETSSSKSSLRLSASKHGFDSRQAEERRRRQPVRCRSIIPAYRKNCAKDSRSTSNSPLRCRTHSCVGVSAPVSLSIRRELF